MISFYQFYGTSDMFCITAVGFFCVFFFCSWAYALINTLFYSIPTGTKHFLENDDVTRLPSCFNDWLLSLGTCGSEQITGVWPSVIFRPVVLRHQPCVSLSSCWRVIGRRNEYMAGAICARCNCSFKHLIGTLVSGESSHPFKNNNLPPRTTAAFFILYKYVT